MNRTQLLQQRIVPEFKNEVSGGQTIITLSGFVGHGWLVDGITEEVVKEALDNATGDIVIRLNSDGGDVFEGIAIYNYLKSIKQHVTVEVTALAASAASIIAMGADEVVMCTGSNLMVHEASTMAYGNKNDLKKVLNALESIDDSLIDIYVNRTNASRKQVEDWIAKETWFTAQEAVDHGFADRVQEAEETDELNQVINELRQEIRDLKASYQTNPTAVEPPVEEGAIEALVHRTGFDRIYRKGEETDVKNERCNRQ